MPPGLMPSLTARYSGDFCGSPSKRARKLWRKRWMLSVVSGYSRPGSKRISANTRPERRGRQTMHCRGDRRQDNAALQLGQAVERLQPRRNDVRVRRESIVGKTLTVRKMHEWQRRVGVKPDFLFELACVVGIGGKH